MKRSLKHRLSSFLCGVFGGHVYTRGEVFSIGFEYCHKCRCIPLEKLMRERYGLIFIELPDGELFVLPEDQFKKAPRL